jgi:CubicO group peptidase (beta-lactamase class C family)
LERTLLSIPSVFAADPVRTLQTIANNFVAQNLVNYLTGVSVTAQCNNLNNGKPITITSGTMGNQDQYPQLIKDNDIWQIGSNSKSFSSIVLIQLASESQYNFSLDDPITKWINENNYPELQELLRYNPTIRQMMNMTSGVPEDYNTETALDFIVAHPYTYEDTLFWVGFANPALAVPPATQWNYANTNYDLFNILVPLITGNSLQTEVTNRIIQPLGLKNTYFVNSLPSEQASIFNLVHGYFLYYITSTDTTLYDSYNWSLSSSQGSGGIISTTSDINTYYRSLYTTDKLLNASQLAELSSFVSDVTGQPIAVPGESPDGAGYALGIGAYNFNVLNNYLYEQTGTGLIPASDTNILANINNYNLVYTYAGSTPGFDFIYFYNPYNGASVVVSYNTNYVDTTSLPLEVLNFMDPICKV